MLVTGVKEMSWNFVIFNFSGCRNKLTEVTQAEKMDIKTVMCVTSRMIVESAHFMVVKKFGSVQDVYIVLCFQNMFKTTVLIKFTHTSSYH